MVLLLDIKLHVHEVHCTFINGNPGHNRKNNVSEERYAQCNYFKRVNKHLNMQFALNSKTEYDVIFE